MKKCTIALLILVAALALCACGRMGTENPPMTDNITIPVPDITPTIPSIAPNIPDPSVDHNATENSTNEVTTAPESTGPITRHLPGSKGRILPR